jgi:hypothetical protein
VELERRGNGVGGGKVVDELGQEARLGGLLADLGGVVLVLLGESGRGEEECDEQTHAGKVSGVGRQASGSYCPLRDASQTPDA